MIALPLKQIYFAHGLKSTNGCTKAMRDCDNNYMHRTLVKFIEKYGNEPGFESLTLLHEMRRLRDNNTVLECVLTLPVLVS